MISGEFDGSATSYNITYSDASSGSICASVRLLPSDCEGLCSHVFQVANSACPPCVDINTTLFATNLLGNGQPSNSMKISNLQTLFSLIKMFTSVLSYYVL